MFRNDQNRACILGPLLIFSVQVRLKQKYYTPHVRSDRGSNLQDPEMLALTTEPSGLKRSVLPYFLRGLR